MEARTSHQNGRVVVEAISKVSSVDLVADPATTSGLFESDEGRRSDDGLAKFIRDIEKAAALSDYAPLLRASRPVQSAIVGNSFTDSLSRIMGTGDTTPNPFLPKAAAPEASRDSLTEILKRPAAPQPSLQDLLSGGTTPPTNRDTLYALLEGRK